jgi:hypothetical protein
MSCMTLRRAFHRDRGTSPEWPRVEFPAVGPDELFNHSIVKPMEKKTYDRRLATKNCISSVLLFLGAITAIVEIRTVPPVRTTGGRFDSG